ncbi:MAG: NUDIX domain-containing protein [bacterium]|nr:NUDIX domain-containing protein [bacterium]
MNKVLYDTEYLQLKSTTSYDGHEWVYAHRPNAKDVVVILPETEDEILFLIEKRPPLEAENKGEHTISLPAGLVGDVRKGESVENAITEELKEEAGIVAEYFEIVANKVASSSGCVSETCAIAIAYIKDKKQICVPTDDGGIIQDRIWIKKTKVYEWINQMQEKGYVLTAHTLAALYYLFNRKGN